MQARVKAMKTRLFICMNLWMPALLAASIFTLKYLDIFFSWWVAVPVLFVLALALLGRFIISLSGVQ